MTTCENCGRPHADDDTRPLLDAAYCWDDYTDLGREACLNATVARLRAELAAAVAAEREACLAAVEEEGRAPGVGTCTVSAFHALLHVARAIRDRGGK